VAFSLADSSVLVKNLALVGLNYALKVTHAGSNTGQIAVAFPLLRSLFEQLSMLPEGKEPLMKLLHVLFTPHTPFLTHKRPLVLRI
jgi:hypothetical protein